jgi:uncharacterized membrane protein YeaQ/YmgE (transglycosylase-associated protein family)
MYIITIFLFGIIAAVITNIYSPYPQGGKLGTIVLGILGAFIGAFIANSIFEVGANGSQASSLFMAVATSFVLLFMGRTLQRI